MVGEGTGPVLDDGEHICVKFAIWVTEPGVVEGSRDVVHHLVEGNVGVLPCVDYSGSYILQDCRGNLACWFVQDVCEVVF